MLNKEHFKCPDCKSLLTSNGKNVFKQSIIVALVVWFLVLVCVKYYSNSWAYAAIVSIEAGGFLAAIVAALYYRFAIRIKNAN